MTSFRIAFLCFAACLVACGDDDGDSSPAPDLGPPTSECSNDTDCPAERPRCLLSSTEGVCVADCDTDDQCPNGACIDNSCVSCSLNPDTALIGDPCVCDQDCLGLDSTCVDTECVGDCTVIGCPPEFQCTGTPGECVACSDGADREAGSPCLCDTECMSGLSCLGGTCAEACEFDETCGRQECAHSLAAAPACKDPDAACFGAGTAALGEECTCNADCDFDAPVCLAFLAEGAPGFVCSQVCGPEQACPMGSMCCGAGTQRYCMSGALAEATGSSCE